MPEYHNDDSLRSRLPQTAFAFGGYNVTNMGRTPELLAHPVYGPIVAAYLREASQVYAEVVKQPVDLVARMREGRESRGVIDHVEDVALIVAVQMAQLRLLEEFHGISLRKGRLALGHSVGEAVALMGAGVYEMKDLLAVLLTMAEECVQLANAVTMGVLFSRGPALDLQVVHRLCLEISQQGRGTVAVSTYLSPNSLLLMGQNDTLARLEALVHDVIPAPVFIRRNEHQWPPLHTSIMWQRCIPNRTAVLLETMPGGFRAPALPILSMITGDSSYHAYNSRELMDRWVDHPQRFWDVICKILANGVETVVHVGPNPSLLLATFRRLSTNMEAQMNRPGLGGLGRRTLAHLVRRPWLTGLLPSFTALYRAPFVQHIILEDWLRNGGRG
jgi:[acyl-carrier-protein] S-malonyltransferase